MQDDIVSPVFLSASTTLQSGSSSGVNAVALRNPLELPMELHEVRIQLSGWGGLVRQWLGGVVAMKLDLGQYQLTNGFVPVGVLSRAQFINANSAGESWTSGAVIAGYDSETTNDFTWRFARPLFVPAGAAVVPTFLHRGFAVLPGPDGGVAPIKVRVGFSGNTLRAGTAPKRVCLPYAAAWTSGMYDYGTAWRAASAETDLVNPNGEQLNIQRFCGRLIELDLESQTVAEAMRSVHDLDWLGVGGVEVKMADSLGRRTVHNFTPFRQVFSGQTRSWEAEGAYLEPRSYYMVQLRSRGYPSPPPAVEPVADSETAYQALVSMVGWREVPL